MAHPLDVFADLQLAIDGEDVDLKASGDQVVVDLPSLRAGRRLLAGQSLLGGQFPGGTAQLQDALQGAGLTAEVRLRGDPVARVGKGARPGRLGRLLRLDGIEVKPARTLRAAVRERSLTSALVIGGLTLLFGGLLLWAWRRNT